MSTFVLKNVLLKYGKYRISMQFREAARARPRPTASPDRVRPAHIGEGLSQRPSCAWRRAERARRRACLI